jgi:hypothetical protein
VNFYLTFQGLFGGETSLHLSPEDIEETLDVVLEELLEQGVPDATVGGTLAQGLVEISMTLEAKTLEDAFAGGLGLIMNSLGDRVSEVEWVGFHGRRSDITEGQQLDLIEA